MSIENKNFSQKSYLPEVQAGSQYPKSSLGQAILDQAEGQAFSSFHYEKTLEPARIGQGGLTLFFPKCTRG